MMREALVVAARLMGQRRERIELNALVEKTAADLGDALGTGIEIRVAVGPTPLWVQVDQRDLTRALTNLARNAAQAMPYGGTLTLATMLEAETQMICVQVRDTGAGMDTETQAHIWEPGFSTKGGDRPRGIGLFQVKKFVEAHGGTVRVESALGAGATLELCFPRALEGAAP
jgi:signal transduction histidine kinase